MYNKKIGSLESHGLINELDNELVKNSDLKQEWQSRQDSYKAERNKTQEPEAKYRSSGGVGGATESIKCLHSHTADELSTGLNPIGKIVLESKKEPAEPMTNSQNRHPRRNLGAITRIIYQRLQSIMTRCHSVSYTHLTLPTILRV